MLLWSSMLFTPEVSKSTDHHPNGWQLSANWAATLRQETSLSPLTGPWTPCCKGLTHLHLSGNYSHLVRNSILFWHLSYTVFFVHYSLLPSLGYGHFQYCVVCFPVVCHLYCFQLEHCLIFHCWCMFCFVAPAFQIVLECNLEDLSSCVCLNYLWGIVWLRSVLFLHACCSWWLVSCLCYIYSAWSVVVVMVSFSHYCTVGPQSTIFSVNHYSRPYWNKIIISRSIMVRIFCLSFN